MTTTHVMNVRGDANDQIAQAAKVLGRSERRIAVFKFIHNGKTKIKSVEEIARGTKLTRKAVLDEAKKLVDHELIKQTKKDGDTAYQKDQFLHKNCKKIVGFAKNPAKLAKFPTKVNPAITGASITVKVAKSQVKTAIATINDVDQFAKAKKIRGVQPPVTMSETNFKNGVKDIVREPGTFKDWGGETSDLYTTRVKIGGKRLGAAFAFKGPGLKGTLTPARLGKNGDQIQRLFIEDADVFFVQYVGQIASSVQQQMAVYAQAKSISTGRKIYYGVIDGDDSARLVAAYPKKFKGK